MGDQGLEAWRLNHEVQVCRSPWVAPQSFEHPAHRSIVRDRVRLGEDRPKVEATVRPAAQLAARPVFMQVGTLCGNLDVVEAVLVRLPHVDHRARNGLPIVAAHLALHEAGFPFCAVRDVFAVVVLRRPFNEKRPEDSRLGATGGLGIALRGHQHRQTERVGQQDELLALVVGDVADLGEEFDRLEPFIFGELDLARKRVKVLYQARHDGAQALVAAAIHRGQHRLGDRVFVDVTHAACLLAGFLSNLSVAVPL